MKMTNPIDRLYYFSYPICFRIGTYAAFIRSFCSAPIAEILLNSPVYETQNLIRLDRARQICRDAIKLGFSDQQTQLGFEQMNHKHQAFNIAEEHQLYGIANFIIEPIRMLRQRAKRRLPKSEQAYFLDFWFNFAKEMKLSNIPQTLGEWLSFRNQYENKYQNFSHKQEHILKLSLFTTVKISAPFYLRAILTQMIIWQLPTPFCRQFKLTKSCFIRPLIALLRFKP